MLKRGPVQAACCALTILCAATGGACGGDGPVTVPPPPPGAPLDVRAQESALDSLLAQFIDDNEPLAELRNGGAVQIMRAMAPGGLPPDVVPPSPDPLGGRPSVSAFKQAATGTGRSATTPEPRAHRAAGREAAFSGVPAVSSGTTYEWDLNTEFWTEAPGDPFGPPPTDGTRFILYSWNPANVFPFLPLNPIEAYADARLLRPQGAQIEAAIQSEQLGRRAIDVTATGTITPETRDFGVTGGVVRNAADEALTFSYEWREDATINLFTRLDGSGPDGTLEVLLDVRSDGGAQDVIFESGGQRIEMLVSFDDNFDVTSSEVKVDGVLVARASGSVFGPMFGLVENSRLPGSQLDVISRMYRDGIEADFGLFELVAAGGCLGSEDPAICVFTNP